MVTPTIFLAVIAAALLHAVWNALVKSARDKQAGMTAVVIGHLPAAALALAIFAAIAAGFTAAFGSKTPQALALGAILIFGVAYLVAQGLADRAPVALTVAIAIFFEVFTGWMIRDNLTLNVLMLVWPLDSVKAWQGGI